MQRSSTIGFSHEQTELIQIISNQKRREMQLIQSKLGKQHRTSPRSGKFGPISHTHSNPTNGLAAFQGHIALLYFPESLARDFGRF
jgi:hypothetical protein